jgi:alkylation response protein AidB-like acyl-CoA dehydrogenase
LPPSLACFALHTLGTFDLTGVARRVIDGGTVRAIEYADDGAGVLGWPQTMPPAAKYALTYLFVQAEFGLCCPVSMTDSLARTLRKFGDPALVEQVLPMVTTQDFDALNQGAMFMTEQGAGSDVSATETQASLNADDSWSLQGDKWFCSNPDAGFAMVLARSESAPGLKGVSLFLLPKVRPDGSTNSYRILRLKDKLGTRSMPSGEIRLEGAFAWLVGERGQGFKHMSDMINNSRLSNGVRAAGLMRRALTEALYISKNRRAFGKRLIDMPLMQRQLSKMAVTTEQARTMVYQTAQALEASDRDPSKRPLMRIMTPLIKFRACRDARKVAGDAMEVRGGCGYIEEFSDEIESWVIDELKRVGLDSAKSVLSLSEEELVRRTDLEEDTVREIVRILQAEFE